MDKESEIKIVDANSQFTRTIPNSSDPFLWEETTLGAMAKSEMLRSGHYIYGNRHNIIGFVIGGSNAALVKAISDDFKDKLAKVIENHYDKTQEDAFGRAILVFPVESSAQSILSKLGDVVPPRARQFGLAKAFSIASKYELRFEPEIVNMIRSAADRSKLLVIFFDDSRSSGETERRAIEALSSQFGIARAKEADKGQIVVFSYAVINRTRAANALVEDVEYQIPGQCKVTVIRTQFRFLPVESTDENNCRLCLAERRLEIGLAGLGEGYFDLVGRNTQAVAEFLRHRYADAGDIHPQSKELLQSLTWHILQLSSQELPSLCQQFVDFSQLPAKRVASLTLYLAASYRDARAFVSEHYFVSLLLATLEKTKSGEDADFAFFSFLLSITLLPIDLATRLFEESLFYQIAADVPPAKIASLLLIILRNHKAALTSTLAAVGPARAERVAISRQRKLVGTIWRNLEELEESERSLNTAGGSKMAVIQQLKATVLALGGLAGERSPITLARLLGIRMFEGKHSSYVKQILTNPDEENYFDGPHVALQVLTTMHDFARIVSSPYETQISGDIRHVESKIKHILTKLPKAERYKAVADFNLLLLATLEQYWHRPEVIKAHFHSVDKLWSMIEETKNELKLTTPFLNSIITDKFNKLIQVRCNCSDAKAWKVLGPNGFELKDLFNNLLTNPFVHFDDSIEAADEAARVKLFDALSERCGRGLRLPLVEVVAGLDLDLQRLVICFFDRAKAAKVEKIALGRKGLGNSQVCLATVDCLLEYLPAGDETRIMSGKVRAKWVSELTGVDPNTFTNVFVVSFPLIYKE